MEFLKRTLDNGLEVVAECNPQAYSAAIGFSVKAGSRDECDANHGVSHFLEHMAFKGTATRSAADVNRELDEIGSHSNAFTSEEQTVYFAAFLPEHLDRAVDLLSDILRPALRQEDFDTEKLVILEEVAKSEDQPPFGAHDRCLAAHFGTHPLGRSILGTTASVGALTRELMLAYHRQRYSPRNITLIGAGHIDFDRFVAQTERCCGQWEPYDAPRDTATAPAHQGLEVVYKEIATQEYVVQLTPGPASEDDDLYAAGLLAAILGDSSGSRMYWELFDKGLAECAVMESHDFLGAGVFLSYLCCAPEATAENLSRMRDICRQAEAENVTPEELERAKSKICSHLVLQSERPINRLSAVGGTWVQRREYLTVRELVDRYRAVTCDDIGALLKKYPLSAGTTVAVGPLRELAFDPRTG